jgi:hypothetical protein
MQSRIDKFEIGCFSRSADHLDAPFDRFWIELDQPETFANQVSSFRERYAKGA